MRFFKPNDVEICLIWQNITKILNGTRVTAWECCFTVSDSWSHSTQDTGAKSLSRLIRCTVNAVSKGGNVLLGVAPDARGAIPSDAVNVLTQ